jgi:hypothetical protein
MDYLTEQYNAEPGEEKMLGNLKQGGLVSCHEAVFSSVSRRYEI